MDFVKIYSSNTLDLYNISASSEMSIPVLLERIRAGFPSPAEDHADGDIDFNKYLIRNHSSTFCGRAKGDSLKGIGIFDGDLMVFDRSLEPKSGKPAICAVNGELTVKILKIENDCCWLMPANEKFNPILVTDNQDLSILAMVTFSIRSHWYDSIG